MNEHEQIIEREQGRWQDAIYAILCDSMMELPKEYRRIIDGAGCDSGDPMDMSISEIKQALAAHSDAHSALRARVADLELLRKCAANFMGLWDAGANDIAILDAATELRQALAAAGGKK